ncbi:hypothetical protein [Pseudomonas sp. W5-36]|uniref:hypothetical protein n=1 Tax=Pseudomonas sp. W5-36 TaxID=3097455 RepID=UPI00397CE3C6
MFFYYDIGFVEERFGCEDPELLAQILGMLDVHIELRRKKALKNISVGLVLNKKGLEDLGVCERF